jgi:hypothetical protein
MLVTMKELTKENVMAIKACILPRLKRLRRHAFTCDGFKGLVSYDQID